MDRGRRREENREWCRKSRAFARSALVPHVQRGAGVNDLFALLRPTIGTILRDWTGGSGSVANPNPRARAIDALSAAMMDLAAAPASLIAAAERACERVAVAYGRELCLCRLSE